MLEAYNLDWIPYQRFILKLTIDRNEPVFLGRFCRKNTALKEGVRLDQYAGYKTEVFDTKENEVVTNIST
jgi:hypothetical protein